MNNLFWTAYCSAPRHKAINEIQKVISWYGDVTDFKFFSDISITLIIEIKEANIDNFFKNLSTLITMDRIEPLNPNAQKERTIFLNISFANGTGDLKIEVPAVPG